MKIKRLVGILTMCVLATLQTLAQSMPKAIPGVSWKFETQNILKETDPVTLNTPLTDGTTYTIKSNQEGMKMEYISAGGEDHVGPISTIPGFSEALFLHGNSGDGKGYFRIPITNEQNRGEGILTFVGSCKGWWGCLKVYGDSGFSSWITQVAVTPHSESSMKLTIPKYTWGDDSNHGPEVEALYIKTQDMEYIAGATWIPEGEAPSGKYTLTYDGNGADGGTVPTAQTYNAYLWVPVAGNTGNLTKEGYAFDGWSDAQTGGSRYKQEWGSSIQMLKNTTLYAVWTQKNYVLTYQVDDGNGTFAIMNESDEFVASGASLPFGTTLKIKLTPEKGYELDYITINDERTLLQNGDSFTMPAKAATLKAKFKRIESETPEEPETQIGNEEHSSWMSAYSGFYELTSEKEVELSFETHATNVFYHSWVIQATADEQHYTNWNEHIHFTTTTRCDAYSPTGGSFYEMKLYNLSSHEVYTDRGQIPAKFYSDTQHAKVIIRLVTDGKNTYMHARMTSLVDRGDDWLYTLACYLPSGVSPLYISASVDNCYLTNFKGRLKTTYPITVSVDPVELTAKANVRITTPEGVELPNGIPAGIGDNLVIKCDDIEGYTFAGWGSATARTENPLHLTVVDKKGEESVITHSFTATYSNGGKPVITTTVPDTLFLTAEEKSYDFVIATNSVGAITMSTDDAQSAIATVAYSNEESKAHKLTVKPHSAGVINITILQAADPYHSEGSKVISLVVAKRPTTLTLSYDHIAFDQFGYEGIDIADKDQPTITVSYINEYQEEVVVDAPLLRYDVPMGGLIDVIDAKTNEAPYFNNETQCFETNNSCKFTVINRPTLEGMIAQNPPSGDIRTDIPITFLGNKFLDTSTATFSAIAKYGISSDKFAHTDNAPEVNGIDVLKNNSETFIRYKFGGWKHNENRYTVESSVIQDQWKQATDNFKAIEGYSECIVGGYEAKDEAMGESSEEVYGEKRTGWFEEGKPYSLPVRGAFMTFNPLTSGTLSVYLLQSGAWEKSEGKIVKGSFCPHAFFITDQNGQPVKRIQATSNVAITEDFSCTMNGGNADDGSSNVAKWTKFRNNLSHNEQLNIQSAWNAGEDGVQQPVQLDNGSWMVVQEGMVKYTFHVTAGETYYVFSNLSKLGFAGCNFVKDAPSAGGDSDAPQGMRAMAPSAQGEEEIILAESLALSDTEQYQAPKKKTLYESITLSGRTFAEGQWSTLTLPFYMREDEVESVFGEGTQLIVMDKAIRTGDNLSLAFLYHELQAIIAGYPYLIKPTKEVTNIEVHNKLIDPQLAPTKISSDAGYTFKGVEGYCTPLNNDTKESLVLKTGDIYIGNSTTDPTKAVLKNSVGKTRMKGYRTYIEAPANPSEQAKTFGLNMGKAAPDAGTMTDGGTTDIRFEDFPEAEGAAEKSQGIYNLAGQRLSDDTPRAKGVYIVNGKKELLIQTANK